MHSTLDLHLNAFGTGEQDKGTMSNVDDDMDDASDIYDHEEEGPIFSVSTR